MTNIDLMQRTLAHVEAHLELWDQDDWVCGTTACFGGHATILSGIPVDSSQYIRLEALPDDLHRLVLPGFEAVHVKVVAQALLDLDEDAAGRLFYADTNIVQVRRVVEEICTKATQAVTT